MLKNVMSAFNQTVIVMKNMWRYISITLLGLFLIFTPDTTWAQSVARPETELPSADTSQRSLKILSWNIYMIPIISSGKIKRARLIAEKIKNSEYDIVVFQEAFHGKSRKLLAKLLKETYPYQLGPANASSYLLTFNSGLWIVSKVPIEFRQEIRFKDCQGIDCWSKKGAALFEGTFEGHSFQVIATHLESGGPDRIRENQYNQIINSLLDPYKKEGVPQIICGDFNIDKNDSISYKALISQMKVTDYEISGDYKHTYSDTKNDYRKKTGKRSYLLDHIFVRENNKEIKTHKRYVHILKQKWSRKHKDLSDHYAIAGEFGFSRPMRVDPAETRNNGSLPKY